jgi:hypothetical protein
MECESCKEAIEDSTDKVTGVKLDYKLTNGTILETAILCLNCYYQK